MTFRTIVLAAAVALPVAAWAAPPDGDQLLANMLDAAGGLDAFRELGVLEITIDGEETAADGTQRNRRTTAYIDTGTLSNMRIELANDVVVARNGRNGWATLAGSLDDRPQASRMAIATINKRLFPLLLPFTLEMEGIQLSEVHETSFEGEPAWRAALTFPMHFFVSPSMETTWHVYVRKSDNVLLAAEFFPPDSVRQIRPEGIRYRVIKRTTIGSGVRLPAQVLLDGIDENGAPTGHVRVTKLQIKVRGPFEPALFLHPDQLEAIEEGMN